MEKENIKNLIREVLREQGGLVPFHAHNGTDSPKIRLLKLDDVKTMRATFNPGSLVDGAGQTTTLSVPGAVLGDYAIASFSLDLQGILLTAYVSAVDTVSVRFQNETTGTIDLASGTLSALIIKKI